MKMFSKIRNIIFPSYHPVLFTITHNITSLTFLTKDQLVSCYVSTATCDLPLLWCTFVYLGRFSRSLQSVLAEVTLKKKETVPGYSTQTMTLYLYTLNVCTCVCKKLHTKSKVRWCFPNSFPHFSSIVAIHIYVFISWARLCTDLIIK